MRANNFKQFADFKTYIFLSPTISLTQMFLWSLKARQLYFEIAKNKVHVSQNLALKGSTLDTVYQQIHLRINGILYMFREKTHKGYYNKEAFSVVPPTCVKNACKYEVR